MLNFFQTQYISKRRSCTHTRETIPTTTSAWVYLQTGSVNSCVACSTEGPVTMRRNG